METFNFSVPQDITVGKGSLSKLPEIAKKLGGKHALIISGPHLEKMGLVKKAADYLASVDIKADTFTDIEANPSVTTVEKATAKYLESGADFIVAFGGGSPMDVAKAVGELPNMAEASQTMREHTRCRDQSYRSLRYQPPQEPAQR